MIQYKKGYKYQLTNTYSTVVNIIPEPAIYTGFLSLKKDGTLTIHAGYAWDGPSGPTIDTKTFMRGSLVHDALYQLMRNEHLPLIYKSKADDELYRICREDGMSLIRSKVMLFGLRLAGRPSTLPKNKKKIYEAP